MEHGTRYDALEAILISLALAGLVVGLVLVVGALLAPHHPRARAFFHPLNALILAMQVLDGSTTWVGVEQPFGLRLPPFYETVFISGLILDAFGGLVFFLLKALLGIGVVLALSLAGEAAVTRRERIGTRLVQLTLLVIGVIPVHNNMMNFIALL